MTDPLKNKNETNDIESVETRLRVYPAPEDGLLDVTDQPMSRDASIETILAAWNTATLQLQETHETLQAEVSRLTNELEKKNRELARQNRLADLGRMASHVAHEVRNTLVPVTLYMSLLKRRLSDDAGSRDILAHVEAGYNALDTTVNDLLNFTSDRQPHCNNLNLRELIDDICESIGPQLHAQSIGVDVDMPYDCCVSADREMLRRAILNLMLNALDAMPDGGELAFTSIEGPAGIELEIADSGPGIDPTHCDQLFDPFFTTKSDGTGLGLAIVQRIVQSHGASIVAINCPEGGAAFTIRFPHRSMRAAA